MELLDRYLHAIKFWLPRAQQDDIVAELSEDIRSEIEEREAKLGHKLNNYEVAAVLKERGRPSVVASRYLPQGYLIGPTLFPIYRRVLIIVVVCYAAAWLIGWIGMGIFHPFYHSNIGALIGGMWGTFWLTTFIALGTVTLLFAILERVQGGAKFLLDWNPLELPAVRDPLRIPRVSSIVEIAVNLLFVVWVTTDMWSRVVFEKGGVRIVLAPAWRIFLWAFVLVAAGNVALAGVNLFRRQWAWTTAGARLALDCAGAAAFCWVVKAQLLVEIVAPNLSSEKAAQIVNAINTNMSKSFPFAVMACVLILAVADLGRMWRLKTSARPLVQALS